MKHDLFENIQFFDLSQNIALGEMLKVLLTLIPLCIPHIQRKRLVVIVHYLKNEKELYLKSLPILLLVVIDGMFFYDFSKNYRKELACQ